MATPVISAVVQFHKDDLVADPALAQAWGEDILHQELCRMTEGAVSVSVQDMDGAEHAHFGANKEGTTDTLYVDLRVGIPVPADKQDFTCDVDQLWSEEMQLAVEHALDHLGVVEIRDASVE